MKHTELTPLEKAIFEDIRMHPGSSLMRGTFMDMEVAFVVGVDQEENGNLQVIPLAVVVADWMIPHIKGSSGESVEVVQIEVEETKEEKPKKSRKKK
jgi:hypothetical protein